MAFLVCCPPAFAEIPDHVATRVLIGEAADQGLKGMICVAEVLRRRGSTKGFYGYHSKHITAEPPRVWDLASKAWKRSAYTNYTNGADHFDNVRKYGQPWWAKKCVQTYAYRDHVFYKAL